MTDLFPCGWDEAGSFISSRTAANVETALHAGVLTLEHMAALLSPAAEPFLPQLAERSRMLTRRRFGNVMQLYIPLYLSNECTNICTYCGFSYHNKIERLTLTQHEINEEARVIKRWGFDHVLVVTGEAPRVVTVEYLESALAALAPQFATLSLEVQPLAQAEYARLRAVGLHSVLAYQETYHRDTYKHCHPKGKKSNYEYRIETPARIGAAGVHKIGLGVLLGLAPWRSDAWFLAAHLASLRKDFWKSRFSLSFPRLRPAEGTTPPELAVSERELFQMLCAFRLFDETLDLSLSTRERPEFRDLLFQFGVTSTSAGSKTEPGGYARGDGALKQFEIADERVPEAVISALRGLGLEPIWKDWDAALGSEVAAR